MKKTKLGFGIVVIDLKAGDLSLVLELLAGDIAGFFLGDCGLAADSEATETVSLIARLGTESALLPETTSDAISRHESASEIEETGCSARVSDRERR